MIALCTAAAVTRRAKLALLEVKELTGSELVRPEKVPSIRTTYPRGERLRARRSGPPAS